MTLAFFSISLVSAAPLEKEIQLGDQLYVISEIDLSFSSLFATYSSCEGSYYTSWDNKCKQKYECNSGCTACKAKEVSKSFCDGSTPSPVPTPTPTPTPTTGYCSDKGVRVDVGKCAPTKPLKCYSTSSGYTGLVESSNSCGCPSGYVPTSLDTCVPSNSPKYDCYVGSVYGQATIGYNNGQQYCSPAGTGIFACQNNKVVWVADCTSGSCTPLSANVAGCKQDLQLKLIGQNCRGSSECVVAAKGCFNDVCSDGKIGGTCNSNVNCETNLECSDMSVCVEKGFGGGGTGGGTGGTGGDGGGTGQVCCQRNLVTAEGLYYFAANAESCNQRGVGGVLGKDPVVAIEKCSGGTGGGGTTCAADEVKQADGTCKKASTGDFTVVKTQPSIPSGRLGTASGGTLLNSLCTADSDCGSGTCEDIETLEAELDDKARSILDRINEAKEAKSNDIKSALAHGTLGKILKFGVGLIINTDAFKEEPKSICVMRREGGFDFKNFFEDNQAAVVGGAIILALLIFLPRLMGK